MSSFKAGRKNFMSIGRMKGREVRIFESRAKRCEVLSVARGLNFWGGAKGLLIKFFLCFSEKKLNNRLPTVIDSGRL